MTRRPELFRVRAVHGFNVGARRVLAGCEIDVDAMTAVELVRAGRAVLVQAADLGPLQDALRINGPALGCGRR